jgi:hypothetical protein
MKHKAPPLYFTLPLRGNSDRAVDAAYSEYVQLRGNDRGLGDALEFITRRLPELRAALAKTHSHRGGSAT